MLHIVVYHDRLSDALMEEMLTGITGEIEGMFDQLAEKVLDTV